MNSEILHSIVRRGFLELWNITKPIKATYPEQGEEHETTLVMTSTKVGTTYSDAVDHDDRAERAKGFAQTRAIADELLGHFANDETLRCLDETDRARCTTLCAAISSACGKLEEMGAPNAALVEHYFRTRHPLDAGGASS